MKSHEHLNGTGEATEILYKYKEEKARRIEVLRGVIMRDLHTPLGKDFLTYEEFDVLTDILGEMEGELNG